MIIQAILAIQDSTNFTVMLPTFLCITTLSQKKNGSNHVRIAKIYITCSPLFDQTSKKTHVSVIRVKDLHMVITQMCIISCFLFLVSMCMLFEYT